LPGFVVEVPVNADGLRNAQRRHRESRTGRSRAAAVPALGAKCDWRYSGKNKNDHNGLCGQSDAAHVRMRWKDERRETSAPRAPPPAPTRPQLARNTKAR